MTGKCTSSTMNKVGIVLTDEHKESIITSLRCVIAIGSTGIMLWKNSETHQLCRRRCELDCAPEGLLRIDYFKIALRGITHSVQQAADVDKALIATAQRCLHLEEDERQQQIAESNAITRRRTWFRGAFERAGIAREVGEAWLDENLPATEIRTKLRKGEVATR